MTSTNPKKTDSAFPISSWLQVHPSLGIAAIDHLFNRFDGAFPGTWKAKFPSEHSIRNWRESWAEALEDNEISPKMVSVALKKIYASGMDFPPNLPQFINLCRPKLDYEALYREAVDGVVCRSLGKPFKWSHPAVYWATITINYEIRNQPYERMKSVWVGLVDAEMKKGEWKAIPPNPLFLPWDGRPDKKNIERIRSMITGLKSLIKHQQ